MSPKRCIVTFDDQLQSLSASPRKVPRTGTLSAPSHPDVFTNTAEGEVIHLSIDYGTKNLPVAYRLGPPTDNARDIHMVWYSFKHPEAPQRAAWLPDGTFLWGFHVEDAINKGQIGWEDVVELWKLALYEDHKTDPIAERLVLQLDRFGKGNVADLVRIHLKAIVKETRERIRENLAREYFGDVDAIPIKLFLNIPQMWKPTANRIMTEAAETAGVTWLELVYEPQSAIGAYMDFLKAQRPGAYQAGDASCVADCGGGTSDVASYEFGEDSDIGAGAILKPIGTPQGSLCGSEFVNQNFIGWLKRWDGFRNRCEKLGLAEIAVIKEASRQFDTLKHDFEGLHSPRPHIVIHPNPSVSGHAWLPPISNNDMVSFFKPVIDEIIRCIDAQITARTKDLFITSGFGKSIYLRNALAARYHGVLSIFGQDTMDQDIQHPVARGALLRYETIAPRGLVSPVSFGIGRTEDYDKTIHLDATYVEGQRMENGNINHGPSKPNKSIVSQELGHEVVFERWLPLLQKGVTVYPGDRHLTEGWQCYTVGAHEETISVQIYCTDLDLRAHDPLLTGRNARKSPLREGVEQWGEPLEMRLPNLAEKGFRLKRFGKKRWHYEVFCKLVLECNGANIRVVWEIARLGAQLYDEQGNDRTSVVKLAPGQYFEICSESSSPFPRTTPA